MGQPVRGQDRPVGRRQVQRTSTGVWLWAIVTAGICVGCSLTTARIVASPLSYSSQQEKILEIAPLDTPREQVVAKLEEAGIEGTFGSRDSIYYCDVWDRENGERWHMNVALLFDEAGKLYDTRPAQASIGIAGSGKE